MEIPEEQSELYETVKNVLEKLLDLMDLPATVTLSDEFTAIDEDGNASSIGLNIEGEDLGILIGRLGQTMASLQHIVRVIMAHNMEVRLPIVLDVEGYKQRRCEGLRALAARLADQVKNRKMPFSMEPMTAFERRVIHLALADHPDVFTESTGVGESRKVVITPKKIPHY
ncbi:MAG: KH domain-containing protein [Dehalococcoidales bacterium]|nr:KH domain-containing protein [Dehalococcoidales bacterium]